MVPEILQLLQMEEVAKKGRETDSESALDLEKDSDNVSTEEISNDYLHIAWFSC